MIYSIVMARDNYMMEHLNGVLYPLKDLSHDYYELADMNGAQETQRKAGYLDGNE